MSSREGLAKALVECLREVSALLEHAHGVAMRQQDALVANDAEAIVLTVKAQEEVLRRIGESDQRAAAVAAELAQAAGIDTETADSESVARAAGYPYGSLIKTEMDHISRLAEQVRRENEVNKNLLSNGMDIITCCLRTLATEQIPVAYSRDAALSEGQAYVLSLDRKA